MTTGQAAQRIGTRAMVKLEGLCVEVKVLDHKQAYGNQRYQVTPISGIGDQWVDESRLTWEPWAE